VVTASNNQPHTQTHTHKFIHKHTEILPFKSELYKTANTS